MSLNKGEYIPWTQHVQIVVNDEVQYFNGLVRASNGAFLLHHFIIIFICILLILPMLAYLYPTTSIFPEFGQKTYKIRKLDFLENRKVNLAVIQINLKNDVRKPSILYVFYSLWYMCHVYNYATFNIQIFRTVLKYRASVFGLWCRNVRSSSLQFSLFACYIVQLKKIKKTQPDIF